MPFSRSVIESSHRDVNFFICNGSKVPIFWEILSNQTICVFIGTTLP